VDQQDAGWPGDEDLYCLLRSLGQAVEPSLYRWTDGFRDYRVGGQRILRVSRSTLSEQAKLNRVQGLPGVPRIHASGLFAASGEEYYYLILDYINGDELWDSARQLTPDQQSHVGREAAHFLSDLHAIAGDRYDIGHYVPTIGMFEGSWLQGHRQYAESLRAALTRLDLEPATTEAVAAALAHIQANGDALEYQVGPRLLHNDFHPRNIIVQNGRLAGVIDWECSQFGEPDFDLAHLVHWAVDPPDPGHPLRRFVKAVLCDFQVAAKVPDLGIRLTIYQLEHELNQLIWNGKTQEPDRVRRVNWWLEGAVDVLVGRDT